MPRDSQQARRPRFSFKQRPAAFFASFEQHVLFYDVFWHANRKDVLLVGPPPQNLMALHKRAEYRIEGSTTRLSPKFHVSQSVMVTELRDVPSDAISLNILLGGTEFTLKIQPNLSAKLADRRVLFTMSKDNSLPWITAWADYHAHIHGVDAVVLFDNGSTNASLDEIAAALEKTNIPEIILVSWPYKFGAFDQSVLFYPFWTHFLQIAGMSVVLRRFAAQSRGILNCDIDELVAPSREVTIFDTLKETPKGLLAMNGAWIEAQVHDNASDDHRAFTKRLADPKARICHQRKWVLDPQQPWVADLGVHPYMHWIHRRPSGAKTIDDEVFFWHFKGINTNWKVQRNVVGDTPQSNVEIDPKLLSVFDRWSSEKEN